MLGSVVVLLMKTAAAPTCHHHQHLHCLLLFSCLPPSPLPSPPLNPTPSSAKHSLDLDLDDDPPFLLCSARQKLAVVLQSCGDLDAAAAQLEAALDAFPMCIAAHAALGSVLRARAASQNDLVAAECQLRAALSSADVLLHDQDGLLPECNRACALELEAADGARTALAGLLAQEGRDTEAAELMVAAGYKLRVARGVRMTHTARIMPMRSYACSHAPHFLCAFAIHAARVHAAPLGVCDGVTFNPLITYPHKKQTGRALQLN